MGPLRTPKATRRGEGPSTNVTETPKVKHKRPQKDVASLPGVQKIKSSLRQTRRLLAKDKLAADVRVATERRLQTLEADLAQAEASRKERNMAVRYHKVKFFERQKVVRKLAQAKKRFASADASSMPQLEAAVFDLRVDLNYILHYPKTKKYISLFPPDIREIGPTEGEATNVNPESQDVRNWIRRQMEAGELPLEPELQLDSRDEKSSSRTKAWNGEGNSTPAAPTLRKSNHTVVPEQDAFFGEEDDGADDSE